MRRRGGEGGMQGRGKENARREEKEGEQEYEKGMYKSELVPVFREEEQRSRKMHTKDLEM